MPAPLPMTLHLNEDNSEQQENQFNIEQNVPKILPNNLTLIEEGKIEFKN